MVSWISDVATMINFFYAILRGGDTKLDLIAELKTSKKSQIELMQPIHVLEAVATSLALTDFQEVQ